MFSASIVFALTCWIICSVHVDVFVLGVNECDAGIKDCPENSVCSDTDVSTNGTATCTCNAGFTGNETVCTDIDECKVNGTCPGVGSQCENTMGSFLCLCIRDFIMVNKTCVHKNDCRRFSICVENAECIRVTDTVFNCSCKSGYTGDGKLNCTDIDECLVSNGCHNNATCKNIPGSYECICGVEVNKGDSCQASSYCPTRASQDNCKNNDDDDDDDDDDNTVIALVSVTLVLLVFCLVALIIAISCVYKMRNSH